jgi:hypothetical protein
VLAIGENIYIVKIFKTVGAASCRDVNALPSKARTALEF